MILSENTVVLGNITWLINNLSKRSNVFRLGFLSDCKYSVINGMISVTLQRCHFLRGNGKLNLSSFCHQTIIDQSCDIFLCTVQEISRSAELFYIQMSVGDRYYQSNINKTSNITLSFGEILPIVSWSMNTTIHLNSTTVIWTSISDSLIESFSSFPKDTLMLLLKREHCKACFQAVTQIKRERIQFERLWNPLAAFSHV